MNVKETAIEVIVAIIPVTILITILQLTVAKLPMESFIGFLGGALLVMLGLFFFLIGVNGGLLSIGEMIGSKIVSKGKLWLILVCGFVFGFAVTIAEPDLQVLAAQVDSVSGGAITKNIILIAVSLGVAIFVALALLRVFLNISIKHLLLAGYTLIFILALFTAPEFVAVSLDAGGVTTGPMTVPFILALGVGVAAVTARKNTTIDSFGMVALASIGPIIAVMLMGVLLK